MDYGDLQVTLKECQIDCEIARREGRTLKEENTSLKAELQALKVKLEETGRLDTTSQEHNLDLLKQQVTTHYVTRSMLSITSALSLTSTLTHCVPPP